MIRLASFCAAVLMAATTAFAQSPTLDQVRQRGMLQCGVSTGLIGFSDRGPDGRWSGFDVDFCRAVAAAVLGDASKVTFTPLSAADRFNALRQGQIDVLSRNSTWTLQREAELGLLFAAVMFHDGQGFMVQRSLNIASALEMDKRKVCVQAGTTAQAGVGEFFAANSMTAEVLTFPDAAATLAAFAARTCDVMTTDNSALFAERLKLPRPQDAAVLPDIVNKEPLGPVTRADDVRWHNIVKWVGFALINAEELGVTKDNIEDAKRSARPDVRRFAGIDGNLGPMLGLSDDWALKAVGAIGNYAEAYERNVGRDSRLGIPRGLNQLWINGGILFAPPVR